MTNANFGIINSGIVVTFPQAKAIAIFCGEGTFCKLAVMPPRVHMERIWSLWLLFSFFSECLANLVECSVIRREVGIVMFYCFSSSPGSVCLHTKRRMSLSFTVSLRPESPALFSRFFMHRYDSGEEAYCAYRKIVQMGCCCYRLTIHVPYKTRRFLGGIEQLPITSQVCTSTTC